MMPISSDMPSLRLPGFHPALPIYRPCGTGEIKNPLGGAYTDSTDIPSLTGLGKPACHLLFKPRRGAISVDTTHHPLPLQAPEERHIGNDGCQPGGTRAKPIFRRVPRFLRHAVPAIYRPYGTGETGMPSSLLTPEGCNIGRHNPPTHPSSSSGGATYR